MTVRAFGLWLFLLLSGQVAVGQVAQLGRLSPDQRVHWIWVASKAWQKDSVPGLRLIDSVRIVARELNDERLLWYANLHRILCRVMAEDLSDKPITSFAGTEAYMEQCPVEVVRASYYCYYGRWCYKRQELEKGLKYMFRARQMFEKIGYANIPERIEYLDIFGHYYYYHEDDRKALYYLEQVRTAPNDGLVWPYAYLNTIGMAYQRLKNYEKAERAFLEAIPLAKAAHNKPWIGISYGNLGITLHLQGQPRQALPFLYTDLALNEQDVPTHSATICLYIAKALMALDSTTKAGRFIARIGRLRAEWPDPGFRANYFETRTLYARKAGNYRQAAAYLDSTVLLNNLLKEDRTSRILTNAENSINAEQYVSDIRLAETEKTYAVTIRNLVLAGLLVLLVLLGISFGQYRAIRGANARLSAQNRTIAATSEQLAEQSAQLRTLMRELHHRVKNNLAIVSGLLNLQAYRLTDPVAIAAVQESQRRVEAMSLIHQRLYRTDGITTLNMADYITDLAESLMAAYGYRPDTFALSIQVSEPEVDVDVAIPLGLVLNELLTNSFKYAFGNTEHRLGQRKQPSLHISLRQQQGLTLDVQDNGPGLDLDQWQKPTVESDSFGRQLIWSLSEQMGGRLTIANRNGAYFQLSIPQAA